ncbi:F0F1 ATP synthase subunit A [uncultured Cyclobacterium sp.]|uniref:F0F1 ATP synthase subunit A n=1 Tax=uncultured Cyclobacterium sp. TaxID=453820 RepID=UPI0030EE4591
MVRKFTRLSILLSVILLTFSAVAMAASDGDEDKTSFIMHHIKDSHEWHFATIGHTHVTLSLPVIIYSSDRGLEFYSSSSFVDPETHHFGVEHNGYFIDDHDKLKAVDESRSFIDLSITKNVAMMFLILAVTLYIMLSASGYYKKHPNKAPRGIASFVEPIVLFVRDEIARPNIGPKYKKFTPYLLTLFFFIWIGNLLGLLPGAANLTGNIAVTATLAMITFFVTNINGNKEYWKHIFATPGVPKAILPILVPVEILGAFITKPAALMVRLFVAITAGHIVILSFIGLIFVFESYAVGVASTLMIVFINVIELLVATIQAYVFTLFSAMYIGSATAEHGHEH